MCHALTCKSTRRNSTVLYSTWPLSLSHTYILVQQCVKGKDWLVHCRRYKLGPKQPQESQTLERGRGHGDQGFLSYRWCQGNGETDSSVVCQQKSRHCKPSGVFCYLDSLTDFKDFISHHCCSMIDPLNTFMRQAWWNLSECLRCCLPLGGYCVLHSVSRNKLTLVFSQVMCFMTYFGGIIILQCEDYRSYPS